MTAGVVKGEGYRHLLRADPRPAQPEPDQDRERLFAVAESVSDARRALRRARVQYASSYQRDLVALEQLVQELMLAVLRAANGEKGANRDPR